MPLMVHEGPKATREAAGRMSGPLPSRDVPIDWAHLSRFTLNDRNLEHEVLGLFAMEAPRYLAKMHAASNRKDWIEAAHTLKGSARAVGAWAIAECAQAAETLHFNADLGAEQVDLNGNRGLKQALEKLSEAVRSTLAYIEHLRSAAPANAVTRKA